jgi:hypothetical protein
MSACTEVFVSATICELRSDRQEVKNTMLTLGIFPIERNGPLGILFLVAAFGLMMVRQFKLALHLSLVSAVLLIGLCQASLAQDYDLAGPDLTPPATLVSSGVTLYQRSRAKREAPVRAEPHPTCAASSKLPVSPRGLVTKTSIPGLTSVFRPMRASVLTPPGTGEAPRCFRDR